MGSLGLRFNHMTENWLTRPLFTVQYLINRILGNRLVPAIYGMQLSLHQQVQLYMCCRKLSGVRVRGRLFLEQEEDTQRAGRAV